MLQNGYSNESLPRNLENKQNSNAFNVFGKECHFNIDNKEENNINDIIINKTMS